MNFWAIQLHPNDMGWKREKDLLKRHSVIGLGDWEEAAKQQPSFENTMQIGDFVIVKHGSTIIALVEVSGNYEYIEETNDLLWFQRRRSVRVLDWYDDKYGYEVAPRKTLERFINHDTKQYHCIIDWILRVTKREEMNTYKTLLKNNYNLILTGAPGTGKTHLAKQIAAQIILGKEYDEKAASDEEKEKMKNQSTLVQFHPSYDYTDFVEGLRPVKKKKDDKLGFERKDGVFKEFCKKALYYSNKDFEILHSRIIEGIKDKTYTTYKGPQSKPKKLGVKINSSNKEQILFRADTGNSKTENTELIKKIFNHLVSQKIFDISRYKSTDFYNLAKKVTNNQIKRVDFAEYKWIMTVLLELYKENVSPYVFIIDEINRGEISKIFGELFYSIDPGYRGKKGIVDTQYQNLIPKKEDDPGYDPNKLDEFRYGFYVPENVYIIGTMNDIDRSVESMDFAMRRRFAWKEIKVEDRQSMLYDEKAWDGNKPQKEVIEEIIDRMNRLNACIIDKKDKIGLTIAYQIGASYFLKLKNYLVNDTITNESWDNLWNNHLEGLLREYLRGTTNIEAKIDRLKDAFYYTSKHNETTEN